MSYMSVGNAAGYGYAGMANRIAPEHGYANRESKQMAAVEQTQDAERGKEEPQDTKKVVSEEQAEKQKQAEQQKQDEKKKQIEAEKQKQMERLRQIASSDDTPKGSVSYNASEDLARIAATEDILEVRKICHLIELRMRVVQLSNADPDDIESVLRRMKKVLKKANKKIKGLQKEAKMEQQEKAARAAAKARLEKQMREERARHKRRRRSKEFMDILNGGESGDNSQSGSKVNFAGNTYSGMSADVMAGDADLAALTADMASLDAVSADIVSAGAVGAVGGAEAVSVDAGVGGVVDISL